jgi:hypothetical protein
MMDTPFYYPFPAFCTVASQCWPRSCDVQMRLFLHLQRQLLLLLLLVFINHLIKIHIKFTYLENCNIEAT